MDEAECSCVPDPSAWQGWGLVCGLGWAVGMSHQANPPAASLCTSAGLQQAGSLQEKSLLHPLMSLLGQLVHPPAVQGTSVPSLLWDSPHHVQPPCISVIVIIWILQFGLFSPELPTWSPWL